MQMGFAVHPRSEDESCAPRHRGAKTVSRLGYSWPSQWVLRKPGLQDGICSARFIVTRKEAGVVPNSCRPVPTRGASDNQGQALRQKLIMFAIANPPAATLTSSVELTRPAL